MEKDLRLGTQPRRGWPVGGGLQTRKVVRVVIAETLGWERRVWGCLEGKTFGLRVKLLWFSKSSEQS